MIATLLNSLLVAFILVAPISYLGFILFNQRQVLKKHAFSLVILLVLCIIFFNKLLFFGQTLASQDFNNIQITFIHFFREAIVENHTAPIWNTTMGGGYDAFSNPLSPYFSPFNLVFVIFSDPYTSANLFLFLQVFFCGVFALLFLESLGLRRETVFFGALVFCFNAFITMRLSPGVGPEYIYTYKWIPLILLFTHNLYKEFQNSDKLSLLSKNFILLAISLAFSFEGNLNITVTSWIMWGIFSLVLFKTKIAKVAPIFLSAVFLALAIYSVKIIPGANLMSTTGGRISETVSGWRVRRINIAALPSYLLPINNNFKNPIFSAGIYSCIFVVTYVLYFAYKVLKKRKVTYLEQFIWVSFILGGTLTTNNPISDIFFHLPIFNRLTIIPAFIVLVAIPTYLFSILGFEAFASFWHTRLKNTPVSRLVPWLLFLLALPLFAEILKGPSIFGNNSYSFNFAKMQKDEYHKFKYIKEISNNQDETLLFIDNPKIFALPYLIELNHLNVLNSYTYFYGNRSDLNLLNEDADYSTAELGTIANETNYVVSTEKIQHPDYQLVKEVGTGGFVEGTESYAILEKKWDYIELQDTLDWSEVLYLYKTPGTEINLKIKNGSANMPIYVGLLLSCLSFLFCARNITGSSKVNSFNNIVKY